METTIVSWGMCWGYIRLILGLHGNVEKNMEKTILGLYELWSKLLKGGLHRGF